MVFTIRRKSKIIFEIVFGLGILTFLVGMAVRIISLKYIAAILFIIGYIPIFIDIWKTKKQTAVMRISVIILLLVIYFSIFHYFL